VLILRRLKGVSALVMPKIYGRVAYQDRDYENCEDLLRTMPIAEDQLSRLLQFKA
jgi:hypothetical protein